jgi:hypothetical protein
MPEPVTITLAAVGMAAISEGIKFLYGQASELLKWRHEKHKAHRGYSSRPERRGGQHRGPSSLKFSSIRVTLQALGDFRL